MTKERVKKIFNLALVLYFISFLIFNWNDVSWVFNYRTVTGLVSDFFNPYPSIASTQMEDYFYPNRAAQKKMVENIAVGYSDKENALEIPVIGLSTPMVFSTSAELSAVQSDLDKGVVYYPGSVFPGEVGQSVILGHSAPPGWPKVKHDWVFSDLQKLKAGDEILVNINHRQYTYVVKKTTIIQRGADIPTDASITDHNVLTLVSCWPPGKDYQRIAVQAELKTTK